jgi:hypothetical protein
MEVAMSFWFLVGWLFFCAVAARIAEKKGRSGWGYFFLSFVFSPFIGIICAALADVNQDAIDRRKINTNEAKRCPHCGELINWHATICRYCNRDFPRLES